MKFTKTPGRKWDWILLLLAAIAIGVGLLNIYSASSSGTSFEGTFFHRQLSWLILSIPLAALIIFIPFQFYEKATYYVYILSILMLVMVLFLPGSRGGVHRWILLGSLRWQPSELAKVVTVLCISKYLVNKRPGDMNFSTMVHVALILLIPLVLILKEPDLGTSLVLLPLFFTMLFWVGMPPLYLFLVVTPVLSMVLSFSLLPWMILIIGICFLIYVFRDRVGGKLGIFLIMVNLTMGIFTPIIWNQLEEYQQRRIISFVNPEKDPHGAGYHIIQSKIAVGSGGVLGKGFLHGTQKKLAFLPAHHTDFIFSIVAEEFGFIGGLLLLMIYFLIIYRTVILALNSSSRFASITAIGIATIWWFQVTVNIGMTIGIFPVTGLPLPFVSYGGSSLLVNCAMVALLLNFSWRQLEY
jgi:rod shape determining protein RodA